MSLTAPPMRCIWLQLWTACIMCLPKVAGDQLGFVPTTQLGGPKGHKIEKKNAVVIMPAGLRIPLPCPQLPELVLNAVNTIVVSRSSIATVLPVRPGPWAPGCSSKLLQGLHCWRPSR